MPDTRTPLAVERVVEFFETLKPNDVARLSALYAPDARFKDPFNDVRGVPAVAAIFSHMFENLDAPQFVILDRIVQGRQCFLTWDFRFRMKRLDTQTWQTIHGGSHLVFNDEGMVTLHHDYWDAAEELYEKLPWLGGLMRWLKRRVNA